MSTSSTSVITFADLLGLLCCFWPLSSGKDLFHSALPSAMKECGVFKVHQQKCPAGDRKNTVCSFNTVALSYARGSNPSFVARSLIITAC